MKNHADGLVDGDVLSLCVKWPKLNIKEISAMNIITAERRKYFNLPLEISLASLATNVTTVTFKPGNAKQFLSQILQFSSVQFNFV